MSKPQQTSDGFRRIIHIDMDCFYAAVEQRDNISLQGKPVAIGHNTPRGVVATASYEARKYGVHSAQPVIKAKKLCPELVIVSPRFEVYKQVSECLHNIFHEYTDIVEPISLDEAYLDVTVNKPGIKLAIDIAKEIKFKIRNKLHLTASAGVSFNKLLAKIASDWKKPDGLYSIHPAYALDFIQRIPIEKFWGVGPVTAQKMHALGIKTGADLAQLSLVSLIKHFGKAGGIFYNFARGIDNRPVKTSHIRKTVSCETTFPTDINDMESIFLILNELAIDLEQRIAKHRFIGHTFTLKVKFSDFTQITRSSTYDFSIQHQKDLLDIAQQLALNHIPADRPIRLLGIGVSNNTYKKNSSSYPHPQLDFGDFSFNME